MQARGRLGMPCSLCVATVDGLWHVFTAFLLLLYAEQMGYVLTLLGNVPIDCVDILLEHMCTPYMVPKAWHSLASYSL